MSTAMDAKIANLKQERSYAVNSKVDTEVEKVLAYNEDQFTAEFLNGDTNNIGVQDLIKLYYEEKYFEKHTVFSWPSLGDWSDTTWENIYLSAISVYGDTVDGFYPPDAHGYGQLAMNKSTPYLLDNGDTLGDSELTTALENAIGDSATATGDSRHISGYIYASSALAEAAGDSMAAADGGSGLYGKRTQNSTVITQQSGNWRFIVGDGGVDDSTYYSDPEKSALLNSTIALANAIGDTGDSYRQKLNEIYTEIIKIKSNNNTIFNESNIVDYAPDDGDSLNAYRSDLNTFAGDSAGDSYPGDTTLWGFYNFFSGAVGTEGSFNIYLNEFRLLVGDSIKTRVTARYNTIDTKIGTDLVDNKLKKARYFWIEQRIGKPMATLISYEGMDDVITITTDKLNDVDERLDFLVGDSALYIPKPVMYSIYSDPRYNDDGSFDAYRISLVWGGQRHATEYKIYRKDLENVEFNNTAWGDTFIIKSLTAINNKTGVIFTEYTDTDVIAGNEYVYRVKIIDDTNDANYTDTRSEQSDVYDVDTGDSILSVGDTTFSGSTASIVEFGDSYNLRKGDYILLIFNSKSSGDGFYHVEKINHTSVIVTPQIRIKNTDTGFAYKSTSIVFI